MAVGKRGFIFSTDMMVSITIFMFVLIAIMYVWAESRVNMAETTVRLERREKALRASEELVSTRGVPVYWHIMNLSSADVSAIGLAKQDHVLMGVKVARMVENNYSMVKHIIGLQREQFNLTVTANWSTTPNILYSYGVVLNDSQQVVVRRIMLLEDEPVEFVFRVGFSMEDQN